MLTRKHYLRVTVNTTVPPNNMTQNLAIHKITMPPKHGVVTEMKLNFQKFNYKI